MRVRGLSSATLDQLDLDIAAGEIVGVAGLDGSGRETLATALVGDSFGRADELTIGDITVSQLSPRSAIDAGIALVLANRDPAAAVRGLSVAENITLVSLEAIARGGTLSRRAERAAVAEWMERLDIRPRDPSRDYATLSGGNRQKVIFAKWLSIAPSFLVLDDPTSGVDVGARQAMYRHIVEAAEGGAAVLVASSDPEDLVRLCDRVLVLVRGHLALELRGADITERHVIEAISPGDDGGAAAHPPQERTPR